MFICKYICKNSFTDLNFNQFLSINLFNYNVIEKCNKNVEEIVEKCRVNCMRKNRHITIKYTQFAFRI